MSMNKALNKINQGGMTVKQALALLETIEMLESAKKQHGRESAAVRK